MTRFLQIALAGASVFGLVACDATSNGGDPPPDPFFVGRDIVADCAAVQCTTLDLDSADLEDYTVLNDMPYVTVLMMSYSQFSDLGAIAGMSQLKELHIGYTNVTDLSGLAAFPDLTLLHVGQLPDGVDHTPVAGLQNLQELAIGGYTFDQVEVIKALPKVSRLLLEVSDDADLSPLRAHPGLEVVDFGSSSILDMSVLTTLPRLREVGVTRFFTESNIAEVAAQLRARGVTVDERDVLPVC